MKDGPNLEDLSVNAMLWRFFFAHSIYQVIFIMSLFAYNALF